MENDKLSKLVDAVINAAVAMDVHPYTVINNLADMIPDEEARKTFVADIQAGLVKIAHTLPWSIDMPLAKIS